MGVSSVQFFKTANLVRSAHQHRAAGTQKEDASDVVSEQAEQAERAAQDKVRPRRVVGGENRWKIRSVRFHADSGEREPIRVPGNLARI